MYGLGELPQGFARLSAIYGGTYMLDTPIDEVLYKKETGKFEGVKTKLGTFKAPLVIADPTYFPENVNLLVKELLEPSVFLTIQFRTPVTRILYNYYPTKPTGKEKRYIRCDCFRCA